MLSGTSAIPLPDSQLLSSDHAQRSVQSRRGRVTHFILGNENRLAAVAGRVFLQPDTRWSLYNPLVLCGPTGSGKTHLADGLAAAWKQRHPQSSIVSARAAKLPARQVKCQASLDALAPFNPPLLVLEDIHQIDRDTSASRRLQLAIDNRLDAGGAVIATSNQVPARLVHLPATIRSRLSGGLVVSLAHPTNKTRRAILEVYAASLNLELSAPAARLLANQLTESTRQLVDAVHQLADNPPTADSTIQNASRVVDLPEAQRYLKNRSSAPRVRLDRIAHAVARHYELTIDQLKGSSRRRAVVTARSVAMYLARHVGGKNLKQIGQYLGGRDHTTVLHGCRKIESLCQRDTAIQQAVLQLTEKLQKPSRAK